MLITLITPLPKIIKIYSGITKLQLKLEWGVSETQCSWHITLTGNTAITG